MKRTRNQESQRTGQNLETRKWFQHHPLFKAKDVKVIKNKADKTTINSEGCSKSVRVPTWVVEMKGPRSRRFLGRQWQAELRRAVTGGGGPVTDTKTGDRQHHIQ